MYIFWDIDKKQYCIIDTKFNAVHWFNADSTFISTIKRASNLSIVQENPTQLFTL